MSGKGSCDEKKSTSLSAKAGLQFPVGRVGRFLRQCKYAIRMGSGAPAPAYLAAVLQYLPFMDPLPLTAGASAAIADDEYSYGIRGRFVPDKLVLSDEVLDAGSRITMQVVGLARLKYKSTATDTFLPLEDRDAFHPNTSIYRPYRLLLSDGVKTVAGKFFHEAKCSTAHGTTHSEIHKLVESGLLKEGTIISFVPNCHTNSGSGIVTMFRMKIEGWREVVGMPPSHKSAEAFSPIDLHECTLSIQPNGKVLDKQSPINLSVILLAKTINEKLGHCVISGSAALAEYLHTLPGCEHCYTEHCKNLCASGIFNNDIDIFVPEYPENLTKYYETGRKDRLREAIAFDEKTLMNEIFPALFQQYGIRHTKVKRTTVLLSRLAQEDSLEPYEQSEHDDDYGRTLDYGCEFLFIIL
eukprot:scaffold17120_cov36-Cyclotella_meneghiniana.AAC.2